MAKVVQKGYDRSNRENVVVMTSKGSQTCRDKSRGKDSGMRARKEKGQLAIRKEGKRGLYNQGHAVASGFYMQQNTQKEGTMKGGSKAQSSDYSTNTGEERWYVNSVSYLDSLEIDRCRNFCYSLDMSMKTKSKGRRR